jgi:hypothetical protein
VCIATGNALNSVNSNDFWPNVLYDTREGILRDDPASGTDFTLGLGGMMNYVTVDVNNLARYLAGTVAPYVGLHGPSANNQNLAGFIVYFSDRRGNKCGKGAVSPSCPLAPAATGAETGEYGFEDNVNPADAGGVPNGLLDIGEDVNAYIPAVGQPAYVAVRDVYGMTAQNPVGAAGDPLGANAKVIDPPGSEQSNQWVGMVNRPIFFRRALKLIHGGNTSATVSTLPSPGLTVAAENPVYVQGNYNATVGTAAAGVVPTETHMGAAILADAVTLLSNNWNDNLSFQFPNYAPSRPAATTAYRFAVVAGKGLAFPYPTAGAPQFLFGTDGGVGNFLRLLESWSPVTIRYRGSVVSMFINRQATGTYKYSTQVYDYGVRNFVFDSDFLLPSLLPPGTPMFRDVNTLTFRQLLRPNQ